MSLKNKNIFLISLVLLFMIIILISFSSFIFRYKNEVVEDNEYMNCNSLQNNSKDIFCNFQKQECEKISISEFSYFCERLKFRPHMWAFINNPNDISFVNSSEGYCSEYEGYEKFYCIINLAIINFSMKNHDKESICTSILDERLRGECKFYLSINSIPSLIENIDEVFNQFYDFCSGFVNPSWKSECFYLIADELSLNSNSTEYFSMIEKSCAKSDNSRFYFCFNHNAILLKEKSLAFCKYIAHEKKEMCYEGYGFILGTNTTATDINYLLKRCSETNYEESCFDGVLQSIQISNLNNNPEFFISYCDIIPDDYKNQCYQYYGSMYMGFKKIDEIVVNHNIHCSKIPEEYRSYCYLGYGNSLDLFTKANLVESVQICAMSDEAYISYCYYGIIEVIGRYLETSDEAGKNLCTSFPLEYLNKCLDRIGK